MNNAGWELEVDAMQPGANELSPFLMRTDFVERMFDGIVCMCCTDVHPPPLRRVHVHTPSHH